MARDDRPTRSDAAPSARIDELGDALATALGGNLRCLAVYGSAADAAASAPAPEINLAIVLERVGFADLRLIGATLAQGAKRGLRIATPLVITPGFLTRARDSFPLELDDLRHRHRILAGSDLLSAIRVGPARVREQAEREARGRLLRLRALAMHRPEDAALRDELASLVSTFGVIERALLADDPAVGEAHGEALFRAVAAREGLRLPALEAICRMRAATARWPAGVELDELLAAALDEVEALVAWVDAHEHGARPSARES